VAFQHRSRKGAFVSACRSAGAGAPPPNRSSAGMVMGELLAQGRALSHIAQTQFPRNAG
jgi:hypothetical protein